MKTLLNSKDKEEIIARLRAVHPGSRRHWGRMSPHQMICHLNDGFRIYMGLMPVRPVPVPYPRSLLRWFALWMPIRWPAGFKTAPELDQLAGGGTLPVAFDSDIEELRNLVDRFVHRPRDFQWPAHPHFGEMSEKEWMRLAYLHMDHHLRQFDA